LVFVQLRIAPQNPKTPFEINMDIFAQIAADCSESEEEQPQESQIEAAPEVNVRAL